MRITKKSILEKAKTLQNWRNVKGIKFLSNGSVSDPSLIYKGYEFNYWDIEDALWSMFLEDNLEFSDNDSGNPKAEKAFNEYLSGCATGYLDDVIFGGYFPPKTYSWRDNQM